MRVDQSDFSYSTDGANLFGDDGTPIKIDAAVEAAISIYGGGAQTAAAWCALNAHFDGRKEEYRLWADVFAELSARSLAQPPS